MRFLPSSPLRAPPPPRCVSAPPHGFQVRLISFTRFLFANLSLQLFLSLSLFPFFFLLTASLFFVLSLNSVLFLVLTLLYSAFFFSRPILCVYFALILSLFLSLPYPVPRFSLPYSSCTQSQRIFISELSLSSLFLVENPMFCILALTFFHVMVLDY